MADGEQVPEVSAQTRSWVARVGISAWSFVGFVIAMGIVATALAAVNEIVLPLTFAGVLAVIFKPAVGALERRGLRPGLGAGVVVLGLIAGMVLVVVATVRGVVAQADQVGQSVTAAIDTAVAELDLEQGSLDDVRAAVEGGEPGIGAGFLTRWWPASTPWSASRAA